MNRKIKSRIEIRKEIFAIFENFKSIKDLSEKIKSYLDNVTGKELIKKDEIDSLISLELLLYDFKHKTKLGENKKLKDVLSSLKLQKNTFRLYMKYDIGKIDLIPDLFPVSIVFNHTDFKQYMEKDLDLNQIINLISEENNAFRDVVNMVRKNPGVYTLVEKYLHDLKQNFVVQMICDRIINLSAFMIYFDVNKNVKENTFYFYNLLNKKFSKHVIQTTITRELKKFKEGKYSVRFSV